MVFCLLRLVILLSCVKEKEKPKDYNLPDYMFLKYVVRSVVFHLIVNVLRFLYEGLSQSSVAQMVER